MFIGHFGVALAAKRLAPGTSLAALIAASQTLDILWPAFLLVGLEHYRVAPGITRVQPLDFYDYPFTHGLVMAAFWALLFAVICHLVRKYAAGAWVVGGLIISHWFLDWSCIARICLCCGMADQKLDWVCGIRGRHRFQSSHSCSLQAFGYTFARPVRVMVTKGTFSGFLLPCSSWDGWRPGSDQHRRALINSRSEP